MAEKLCWYLFGLEYHAILYIDQNEYVDKSLGYIKYNAVTFLIKQLQMRIFPEILVSYSL